MTRVINHFLLKDFLPATFPLLLNLYLISTVTSLGLSQAPTFDCPHATHPIKGSCVPDRPNCIAYWENSKCRTCLEEFQLIVESDERLQISMFFGKDKSKPKWQEATEQEQADFGQGYTELVLEYLISLRQVQQKKWKINFWKLFKSQFRTNNLRLAKNKQQWGLLPLKAILSTDQATFQIYFICSQNSVRDKIIIRPVFLDLYKIRHKAQEFLINLNNPKISPTLRYKLQQVLGQDFLKSSIGIVVNGEQLANILASSIRSFGLMQLDSSKVLKLIKFAINTKHYKLEQTNIFRSSLKNMQISQIDNFPSTHTNSNTGSKKRFLLQTTISPNIQITGARQLYNISSINSGDDAIVKGVVITPVINVTSSSSSSGRSQDRSSGSTPIIISQNTQNNIPAAGPTTNINTIIPQINALTNITRTPQFDTKNLTSLLDESIYYVQYLDIVNFLKTPIYDVLRSILFSENIQAITQSQLLRISVADHGKYYLFQTVWQILVKTQDVIYYTFSIDKTTRQMQLVSSMKLPKNGSNKIILDDTNRDSALSQLDSTTTDLLPAFIQKSPYYNKNSKLYEISLSTYFDNKTNTSVLFSSFKYYYSSQLNLNLNYEYIYFRYTSNTLDPKNTKSRGLILAPIEQFINTGYNNDWLNQSLSLGVSINIMKDKNVSFDIWEIWQSVPRVNIFRIEVDVASRWMVNYEIDMNNVIAPRLRMNRTIDNQLRAAFDARRTSYIVANKNKIVDNIGVQPTQPPSKVAQAGLGSFSVPAGSQIPLSGTTSTPSSTTTLNFPAFNPSTTTTTTTTTTANTATTTTPSSSAFNNPSIITFQPTQQTQQTQRNQQTSRQTFIPLPAYIQPAPKPKFTTSITFLDSSKIFNLTNFIEEFPKRLKDIQKKDIVPDIEAGKVGQLYEQQIKQKIALFFRISTDDITDVRIQKRQSLLEALDTYTVDYTQFLSPRNLRTAYRISHRCRFIFQSIPKPPNRNGADYPVIGAAGGTTNSKTNTSPGEIVYVSLDQALYKSLKFWAAIFSKTFAVNGTKNTAAPPVQTTQLSPNDPKYIPTLMSSAGYVTNSDQLINDFLTKIPDIIPLKFISNPESQNPESFILQQPQALRASSSLFLDQFNSPAIYQSNLIDSKVERAVQNKQNYKMISFRHAYYGDVRVWASLNQERILAINYTSNGYMVSSSDINLVRQIPEVFRAQKNAAQQISIILDQANYLQLNLTATGSNPAYRFLKKQVLITDLFYWKYKRINTLIQIQFYYKFSEFIIKTEMMLDTAFNFIPSIASMQVFCNRLKKKAQDQKREKQTQDVMKRPQWANIQNFLTSLYSNVIKNYKLESITVQTVGNDNFYELTYQLPGNRTKINFIYNYLTRSIRSANNEIYQMTTSTYPQKGCKTQNFQLFKCTSCLDGFVFQQKNGQCYQKIPYCVLQTGQICLVCDSGYIVAENLCQ